MTDFLSQFLQQLINGLSIGAIYALIAIGYTMVYGIVGMINFAHGEVYMIGAYIGLVVITAFGAASGVPVPVVLAGALIFSAAATGIYGYAVEQIAYKPLRGAPRLVPLISALGVSVFLQNYVGLGQGAYDLAVPNLMSGDWSFNLGSSFTVTFSYARMLIIVVTLVLMVGLTLFIRHSRLGQACRACSQDMAMANLLGIDTNKVISFTFVLGAVLASVGGVLIGQSTGKINPFIGFIVGMKAFTAAVLGGIGSIPGAMLGGFVLGLAETFYQGYWSPDNKDVVSFGLLIVVLLVMPNGLLGKKSMEKV